MLVGRSRRSSGTGPLEGVPGELAAEVCSNARARHRVELGSAAIWANAPFWSAEENAWTSGGLADAGLPGRLSPYVTGDLRGESSTSTIRDCGWSTSAPMLADALKHSFAEEAQLFHTARIDAAQKIDTK